MKRVFVAIVVLATAVSAFAQSEGAYDVGGDRGLMGGLAPLPGGDGGASVGLLDPSRFTVNHSMSFMAGGSQMADVQSQSVYSTMFQYRFNAPVVLSLNFDMPIHSTFNQYNNFTQDNLESLDYFRNMPIDASIAWQPTQNFMLRVSVIRQPESSYFYNGFYRSDRFFRGW